MKSFEVNRSLAHVGIAQVTPIATPTLEKPPTDKLPTAQPPSSAPLGGGLVHTAPQVEQAGQLPTTSAAEVFGSQQTHRRGRTAALRVRDVRSDADPTTRRAFKALIDLAGPLQEALSAHGIKR